MCLVPTVKSYSIILESRHSVSSPGTICGNPKATYVIHQPNWEPCDARAYTSYKNYRQGWKHFSSRVKKYSDPLGWEMRAHGRLNNTGKVLNKLNF